MREKKESEKERDREKRKVKRVRKEKRKKEECKKERENKREKGITELAICTDHRQYRTSIEQKIMKAKLYLLSI